MKSIKRVITTIGTCASIISLAFIPQVPSVAKWIVGGFGMLCMVFLIIDEIRANRPDENEIVCTNESEIKEAMIRLIKTQGKVCIMSRNLSWADQDVMNCIKGKKDSVKIFAQSENEITKNLSDAGVSVKYYGTGFEPHTRFTVLRPNKEDRQVAIAITSSHLRTGKKKNFEHIIYLTGGKHADKRDGWITSLAKDLIDLCDSVSKTETETDNGEKES